MRHLLLLLLPVLASGATSERAASQIQYAIGQNVVPVYEGWTRNPDGSATMTFGYMNRNYEEELDIPVGADNRFEPGEADRGQPTHFYVRRQMFVFDVIVPKDWGSKELVWSLTAHGRTDKAYATLKPDYELSDVVVRENRLQDMGQGGGEPNTRPTIRIDGTSRRSTAASAPISLTCLLYTSPSPRDGLLSRMPSSA